jgi:hypothetical protein
MNTKLTGIINEGDTREIMDKIENLMGSGSERKREMAEIKADLSHLRQTVDQLHVKIDRIEMILKNVSE